MADEIIEELWRIKDDMAREHNYDIRALAAYLQQKDEDKHARDSTMKILNECSGTRLALKTDGEGLS